jgi:hypothetical protein
MDNALLEAVLGRLDEHKFKPEVEALLLAACSGKDELQRALGGRHHRVLRSHQVR